MHPSSSSSLRAFQRQQEHGLKHHPGLVDLITTKHKQNKLPSFIDRLYNVGDPCQWPYLTNLGKKKPGP
jgi:hypothetical protein